MSWSEFRSVPTAYDESIEAIDKQILRLIRERKGITRGKRFFPPKEIVQAWADEFIMEVPRINGIIHGFADDNIPKLPNGPGKLLRVLSIMKKSVLDGFEYEITHAMQHEDGSIVHVEINQTDGREQIGFIRPRLLLDVSGETEYGIRSNGAHGGDGQSRLSFMVTPRLPDSIGELQFRLIPYAHPMERPRTEVILDQEVAFE